MADKYGELYVELLADNRELKKQLSQMEKELRGTANRNEKAFKSSFKRIGAGLLAAFGIGTVITSLVRFVGSAISQFREFEKAMKNVNTIAKLSNRELRNMSKEVRNLAGAVGGDATDIAKGLYQAVSAGIEAGKAMEFMATAARAAQAGLSTTETAVDGLTTVINAWGYSTEDANKVADIMFKTVERGKTTFEELSGSLSTVAGIAANSGVAFEQVAAAIATLTKQGVPTAQATTQIRAAIIALNEQLGDGWTGIYTLSDAMGKLRDKAGGSSTVLKEMTGRVEGVNAILGLTGKNAQGAGEDLKEMATSSGAALKAFQEQMTSTDKSFSKFAADWTSWVLSIAEKFTPAIEVVIGGLRALAEELGIFDKSARFSAGEVIKKLEAQGASIEKLKGAYAVYLNQLKAEATILAKNLGIRGGGNLEKGDVEKLRAAALDRILNLNQEITDLELAGVNASEDTLEEIEKQISAKEQVIEATGKEVKQMEDLLSIYNEASATLDKIKGTAATTPPPGGGGGGGGIDERYKPAEIDVSKYENIGPGYVSEETKKKQEKILAELYEQYKGIGVKIEETNQETGEKVVSKWADISSGIVNTLLAGGITTIWSEITENARRSASTIEKVFLSAVDSIVAALSRMAAESLLSLIPGGNIFSFLFGQHGGKFQGKQSGPVKKMQGGGSFNVPYGFQNDRYPLLVESGETVNVASRGRTSMQEALLGDLISRVEALNQNIITGSARSGESQKVAVNIAGELKGRDIKLSYDKSSKYIERFR
jgi:TP901 family phage tail tape measure protein